MMLGKIKKNLAIFSGFRLKKVNTIRQLTCIFKLCLPQGEKFGSIPGERSLDLYVEREARIYTWTEKLGSIPGERS
jgi:hypothetical protein